MRAPVQGARIAIRRHVRRKEKRSEVAGPTVPWARVRKQFYSGRMETQSVGSFQLRWEPLGDSMGKAPRLQGRLHGRSSIHVRFSVLYVYLFWNMNYEPT